MVQDVDMLREQEHGACMKLGCAVHCVALLGLRCCSAGELHLSFVTHLKYAACLWKGILAQAMISLLMACVVQHAELQK